MQTQTGRTERRALRKTRVIRAAAASAENTSRMHEIARKQDNGDLNRSYGNAVRDISRDASRRGLTSNKPLKVNVGGYVISTAPQTQPLTREQLLSEYY